MGGQLARTAVDKAREARRRLASAMAELQATVPIPDSAEIIARRVARAVRHLYAAETRDESGITESIAAAMEILREVLSSAQASIDGVDDQGAVLPDGVTDAAAPLRAAMGSLAASLTLLHPANAELARPRKSELPGVSEEPVLLLSRRRESGEERRGTSRVPVEAAVGFHTDTNFFAGYAGDLSDGGLFIATPALLPKDTPISLSFILAGGRQIAAEARVSWLREPSEPGGRDGGMGVVFEDLSEADRQAIMEFIRRRAPFFHG